VGVGVFLKQEAQAFQAVLPGLTWAEKSGTFVNHDGREQKFQRSILPQGQSKALSESLMLLANQGTGTGAA
jgi:predicted molibdopterin-dependent oxidoreductase YjgC